MKTVFFFLAMIFVPIQHALSNSELGVFKLEENWQKIMQSAYQSELPSMKAPSAWESLSLFDAGYSSKAFAHQGDVMMQGRAKLIHGFGTSIKVAFVKHADTDYTGIFDSGALGLMRVSLAVPPSDENPPKLVPGLAIKFFIDNRASLNLMAMPSLDGQYEQNIFAHEYTTNLAKPSWSVLSWLLENRFAAALSHVGQEGANPRSFSLLHLAHMNAKGEIEPEPKAPFAVVLSASKELREMFDACTEQDFRARLEGKGEGIVLFRVFAHDRADKSLKEIGKLVANSHFVASQYADSDIFFKHPKMHTHDETNEFQKSEL